MCILLHHNISHDVQLIWQSNRRKAIKTETRLVDLYLQGLSCVTDVYTHSTSIINSLLMHQCFCMWKLIASMNTNHLKVHLPLRSWFAALHYALPESIVHYALPPTPQKYSIVWGKHSILWAKSSMLHFTPPPKHSIWAIFWTLYILLCFTKVSSWKDQWLHTNMK